MTAAASVEVRRSALASEITDAVRAWCDENPALVQRYAELAEGTGAAVPGSGAADGAEPTDVVEEFATAVTTEMLRRRPELAEQLAGAELEEVVVRAIDTALAEVCS